MAYRNGTYITFHAGGTSDPTASDQKYYRTLQMWDANHKFDFEFVNSHEKTSAVRDTSKRRTLRTALVTRLLNSKNMLLILTPETRNDTDWVPFEIEYAVDTCGIPLICAYPDYLAITHPAELYELWPDALLRRINAGTARAIHVPFREKPIVAAVSQFDVNNQPSSSLVHYRRDAYVSWGLIKA